MSVSAAPRRAAEAAGWLVIGRAEEVPLLEGRAVTVDGRRLAVFHLLDAWTAIDHACPHRGGPLSDGLVADGCVTCPLHGQRFSLLTGERQDGPGPGVEVHAVRERDGLIELRWPAA
jgi:nitrite reductase (NADH) small subunit